MSVLATTASATTKEMKIEIEKQKTRPSELYSKKNNVRDFT